ncbi:DoxX family protein, partial [Streptomyces sp. SID7499]|nr:DoxX family protein [Streptomyces sp. SID7499]
GAVALDRFFGSRNTSTTTTEDTPRRDKTPAVSV